MGRRKTVAELQKQLQYAQARANYNPPAREAGAATQRRPKIGVKYAVLSPLAEADAAFTVQASKEGVAFFGGVGALGLADAATDPSAPKGFQPAKLLAMVADATPQLVRAKGSNRPYIRYGKGTRDSNAQYNYSAPITADAPANLKAKVTGVITAKKTQLGGAYGRIWFEPEDYPYAASGV
ncbi:hypothetical protein I8748_05520 [Nostoc sp. CENA67]|uniref:Uncharacterized protein n=1 Tax=Amazonocrinis nigriterrae CENA67 TaxID=2794033 RepID=A0A8J7HLW3_9NOST|nr:hypothetical protein [Amazonocrinis nigriterrae]MBH8561642.1 hypothetical protein [Amazonocrinis nigriterrae CENA67]